MILIRVIQGLGNQMFQFALGIVLSEKYEQIPIKYDITHIANEIANRKMVDVNEIFESNLVRANFKEIRKITGIPLFKIPIVYRYLSKNEYLLMYYHAFAKKFRRKTTTIFIREPQEYWNITDEFVDKMVSKTYEHKQNYYLLGFWEDIKYFEEHEVALKKYFKFKNKFLKEDTVYNEIISSSSVALHVRRGDFFVVSNENFEYRICGLNYYLEAIKIINSIVKNPRFFVFSDDTEYVKKTFDFLENKVIISGNRDYIDMQLMSLCKHNIIANSSFSFWSAFLNDYEFKTIIHPIYYYRKKVNGNWKDVKLPAMKKWIGLDNIELIDINNK